MKEKASLPAIATPVMSVPHYDEEYGDSLPESLAEEFGPEIATAVLTSDQLTPHLRDRLIDATHHARESRHALLQGLNNEHTALKAADENLTRLSADLNEVLSAQSFHTSNHLTSHVYNQLLRIGRYATDDAHYGLSVLHRSHR